MTLIAAQKISKSIVYQGKTLDILREVSLEISAGELVALSGPSGSGKSTLLNILGGLDQAYQGEVAIAVQKLSGLREKALAAYRNRHIGFIFQAYNLLGHFSVLENVLLPFWLRGEEAPKSQAQSLIAEVGLGDKLDRLPKTLSGGERQRVAIVRALLTRPEILLCDEPTGNLDSASTGAILALFERLKKNAVTILIATHDELVLGHADRLLKISKGVLQ